MLKTMIRNEEVKPSPGDFCSGRAHLLALLLGQCPATESRSLHLYRHPASALLSSWLQQDPPPRYQPVLVEGRTLLLWWCWHPVRGARALGKATQSWARTPALALTSCVALDQVGAELRHLSALISKWGQCVPVCREWLWGLGMLCVLPSTQTRGH